MHGPTRQPRHLSRARRWWSGLVAVLLAGTAWVGSVPPSAAVPGPVGAGFTVTAGDLSFILRQIRIAERHANTLTATEPCGTLVGTGPNQIASRLASYGLRTVDGSCNNLFAGRETYGAADEVFPRLTQPRFRTAEGVAADELFAGSPARSGSTYAQKKGSVYDSEPRTVSNLIVDQTAANPAAVAAAGEPVRSQGNTGVFPCDAGGEPTATDPDGTPDGCVPEGGTLFIPNVTTDVGLSPPYNSLFTFFGQFFDHGVDQTLKGNGTVFIPLKADDPLRTLGPDGRAGTGDELGSGPQFMAMTRALNQPGPDGVLGDDPATAVDESADDLQETDNSDSPWIDQSQTYASHASHQVFLREYDRAQPGPDGVLHDDPATTADESADNTGAPRSTGRLLGGLAAGETYADSPDGRTGMATWASTKRQAADELGLRLSDEDALDVPALLTDPYGQFIPGPNGLPQYLRAGGGTLEGSLAAPVAPPADVVRFHTPFLTDIAHAADPTPLDADRNPATPPVPKQPDADDTPGLSTDTVAAGEYDDELLDSHFVAGDGRVNENIALTFIHQVFHSEHDRLVADIDATLHAAGNEDLLAGYQAAAAPEGSGAGARAWSYGDRLFQAARFVTEMEYQHVVFEDFGRKMVPAIHPFQVYSPDVNPATRAEFAHAVYRFGHSMLNDVVARRLGGTEHDMRLLDAFLNPPGFFDSGDPADPFTPEEAGAAIAMGSADQAGNELDEFVTQALRSNLLGLPLDLAALNIARARDTGVPRLNDVRRQIYASTNDSSLKPYTSWADLGNHLKHPQTLVNLVAAYGRHPSVLAATTLSGKRAAARALVDPRPGDAPPADAAAFMLSSTSSQLAACAEPGAGCRDWSAEQTGLEDVDLWVGGLAEVTNLFGGLLGSTFTYVFQTQMEMLQDHDRFYYLARTPGLNLRAQLEANSFSEMIQRNTDGTSKLKADAFGTADCKFDLANLAGTAAAFTTLGSIVADDPTSECDESALLMRQPDGTIAYRTRNTVDPAGINGQSVYEGTSGVDRVNGGNDNDTFWGGPGADIIEGNGGDDVALGGEGDDRVTDLDGFDLLKGGPGDDYLESGPGDDINMGGDGQDVSVGGLGSNEAFGGEGSDFVQGGNGADTVFGDGGSDWIQGGAGQDLLIGDHGAPFFDDPGARQAGHEVFVGQAGENDYDAEGGDDILSQNAAVDRNAGAGGFDWATHQYDTVPADDDMRINQLLDGLQLPVVVNRDRWAEMEAVSGSARDDVIRGDDTQPAALAGAGFSGCNALDAAGLARIPGLAAIVPPLDAVDSASTAVTGGTTPTALLASDLAAQAFTGTCPLQGHIWGDGNILIGGSGSDLLEGRGGDDVIDGDRTLEVRIAVMDRPEGQTGAVEIGSTDLLESPATQGTFGAGTAGMSLVQAISAGLVDPGHLQIARRIVVPTDATGVDVALFSGLRSDYTVTAGPDGSLQVRDTRAAGRTDGTDLVRNVEQLRFSDQTVTLTPPAAPTAVQAVAGDARATLSWTAPASTSAFPVTGHTVQVLRAGAVVSTVTGLGPATTATITGLTNGLTYTFRVIALNAVGPSAPSAESNAIIPVVPLTVTTSTPANAATGVPIRISPTATFDRAVTGVSTASVVLTDAATGVVQGATVVLSADGRTVTVDPTVDLAVNRTFRLRLLGTLPSGAAGIVAGGVRLTDTTIAFTTTADGTAPAVTAVLPASGAVLVNRASDIRFDTGERVVGVTAANFTVRPVSLTGALGTPVAGAITTNATGTRWTLNPTVDLGALRTYRVTLTSGVADIRDAAGNPLRTNNGSTTTYTWSFITR